jgi:soluble lytic murein transglycosylase-like protein
VSLNLIAAVSSNHPALDTWDALINDWASAFDVPPNLVKAHMEYESDGNPNAIGSSGRGCGLMQIDYGTYQDAQGNWIYTSAHGTTAPGQIFDPSANIKIACRDFIAPSIAAFGENIDAVIAAYNAGIGVVQAALRNNTDLTTVTFRPWYIPSVRSAYEWYCANATRTA